MSMAIDALRLGVVQALSEDPVIAGIVADRVLDSRMAAYSDGEPVPIISVYTEEDAGEPWSANNGGPSWDTTVDLVLEIMFQTRALSETNEPLIGIAETNRETEALLNLLRTRCEHVIAAGDSPWSLLLRRHVIRRVTETNSKRFRTDDAATKAALRLVTLKVQIKCDEDDDPVTPATGPFAALPNPLRAICEAMPEGSSGLAACSLLNTAMEVGSGNAPAPFEGMDMLIRPGPKPRPSPTDGAEFGAAANTEETP